MAGFTGNPRKLGAGGIPPGPPPPVISETASVGTDTYYIMGITLAEDISPTGPSYPPVQAKATASTTQGATDTYYILGCVLAESTTNTSASGTFQVTVTGSVGSDTYYIFGLVLSE